MPRLNLSTLSEKIPEPVKLECIVMETQLPELEIEAWPLWRRNRAHGVLFRALYESYEG
jgi:hypothetical protein